MHGSINVKFKQCQIPEDGSPWLFIFVNKVIGLACTKGCL